MRNVCWIVWLGAMAQGVFHSEAPFFFSADVAEGNYNVTVTLGGDSRESITTVKAEARRLVLEKVRTAAGESTTRTFTVNVRYRELKSGQQVRLKPRELDNLDWDHRLTLEFNGVRPRVGAIEIARVEDAITVYLAGDSTVVDQDKEPWAAWGQMLPRFFKPGVAIANHAESGETLKAFMGERRFEKILDTIRSGDYLSIHFWHNDQKAGPKHLHPFTTYKEYLRRYIDAARAKGAIPVLVTSMNRRTFDAAGRITNSLRDYPEAIRQTAKEQGVALIDLNAMSKVFYQALRPEKPKTASPHSPPRTFPHLALLPK